MGRILAIVVVLGVTGCTRAPLAQRGFWSFESFPSAAVRERYGFEPDQAWLDKVRLASLRLAGFHTQCSASVVSPKGLVMTNYHCLEGGPRAFVYIRGEGEPARRFRQLPLLSGFYAESPEEEIRLPMVLDQLIEIEKVMSQEKTGGQCGLVEDEVVEAALSSCEEGSDNVFCQWVERLSGRDCQYYLYKYRRFLDVRLVFVPERAVALPKDKASRFNLDGVHSGRYSLDVAFLRVYAGGEPLSTEHYLRFSKTRVKEGELIFASGSPGEGSSNPQLCSVQGYDPPDSQPRLTYGAVKGYFKGLRFQAVGFSLGDVLEKAPQKSISLPARWHFARKRLNPDVLYGFSGALPLAGGSSGSSIVNRDAEVVGLAAEAEAQDVCSYDEGYRAYAITSEVIVELLAKVYGAGRLAEELVPLR
ncbi:MAG: S46 family peptidase [Myxococcaceae bacterium]|nr:S46 family peptidase [Myxococcaceae bacterium]